MFEVPSITDMRSDIREKRRECVIYRYCQFVRMYRVGGMIFIAEGMSSE